MAAVFREHAGYVADVAARMVGRSADMDDVVQDVFIEALRGLRQIRDLKLVKGWLKTVTVRVAARRLKRQKLRTFFSFRDDDEDETENYLPADLSVEEKARLRELYRALHLLPVNERLAWILHRMDEETIESTASLCGCSVATAKRRIAAAQRLLEGMLNAGTT